MQHNTRQFMDFLTEADMEAVTTRGSVAMGHKATYRPPGMHETGPPWTRGRYQQLDYISVSKRWANGWGGCGSRPDQWSTQWSLAGHGGRAGEIQEEATARKGRAEARLRGGGARANSGV